MIICTIISSSYQPYVYTTAEQRFYIHPAQHIIILFTFVFRQFYSLYENSSQPSYSHHNTLQCMLRDEIKTKKTSTLSTYPRHKHNPSFVPIKQHNSITTHTNGTLSLYSEIVTRTTASGSKRKPE